MLWFCMMLLPFVGAALAYLFLRRHAPVWFDALVIIAAAAYPCIIWFRPQLVAVDAQDLLEIQDMTGVLVPLAEWEQHVELCRYFQFERLKQLVARQPDDIVAIVNISVAVMFLALYQSKSRWAWHLVVASVPFTLALYWILRLAGYARYQPRVHSLAAEVIGVLFQVAFFAAVLVWLLHIRDRYFRYTENAEQRT